MRITTQVSFLLTLYLWTCFASSVFWLILSEAVTAGKTLRLRMLPMATVAPFIMTLQPAGDQSERFCWLRVTSQRRTESWCHLFLERFLGIFTGVCESEYMSGDLYLCGIFRYVKRLHCLTLTHYSLQVCSAAVKCVSSPSQSRSVHSMATLVMLFLSSGRAITVKLSNCHTFNIQIKNNKYSD